MDDEDDLDYRPKGEIFTIERGSNLTWAAATTRKEWTTKMVDYTPADNMPPPPYWLAAQKKEGRERAMYNIWHNRYDLGRRLSVWILAPLEDFRRAGYLVKE